MPIIMVSVTGTSLDVVHSYTAGVRGVAQRPGWFPDIAISRQGHPKIQEYCNPSDTLSSKKLSPKSSEKQRSSAYIVNI